MIFARAIVANGFPVPAGTSIVEFRQGRPWVTEQWIADAFAAGHLVPAPTSAPPIATRPDQVISQRDANPRPHKAKR